MPGAFGPDDEANPDVDVSLRRPPFPILVTLAGIAWIGFGCLIFLGVAVVMVMVVSMMPGVDSRTAMAGYMTCGACLPVLFGAAFTVVGVQSVRGTAKDTLGNGIGSIVIGILIACLALAQLGASQLPGVGQPGAAPPGVQAGQAVGAMINAACGVGLIAAGILALAGRSDYRAWRQAQKPDRDRHRDRNRRRRDEEEERDDEPHRLGRDEDDDKFRA